MIICYFGTYEESYPRNVILVKQLRALGHTLKECHVSLWGGKADKTKTMAGFVATIAFGLRLVWCYGRLVVKYTFVGPHDVVFVGYFGHLDVIVLRVINAVLFRRKKVIFDVFLSLFDSMILDRKMAGERSFLSRATRWLDTTACAMADRILVDTDQHKRFFHDVFGVPLGKMVRVFASADEDVFCPRSGNVSHSNFNVLFYGKYIPLHGIEYIVGAANMLRQDPGIRFTFIGKGQLHSFIRQLVADCGLENIEFVDWVRYEELPSHIERADVCLGVFGAGDKTARVIPNKVFQAMAMGKPIITGRTIACDEGLSDGENVVLCRVADSEDLAHWISVLKSDSAMRDRIGANARATFKATFGGESVRSSLAGVLGEGL